MQANVNGHLPEGYFVKGTTLFSSERRLEPMCKAHYSGKVRRRDFGPRPICSWSGDGVDDELLVRVARLDLASRHGSPAVKLEARRELASIFST